VFDELFSRFEEWYWRKPYLLRWCIHFSLFLFLHQVATRHFEGEFTITLGQFVGLLVGSGFSAAVRRGDPPDRPEWRPRPEDMSLLLCASQKAGRYLVAMLLITIAVLASDAIVAGDSSLGSKAHLTFLMVFTWLLGANLPFWQPNRVPTPRRQPLPPFPAGLEAPHRLGR